MITHHLSKPRIHETLLFIALLSGPPRFRNRDAMASFSGDVDWSILLNAAVWGLATLWLFLNIGGHLLKGKSIPRFGPLHILAFVLVICLYISTLASPAPLLSFYRVSQILIAVLFGFFWIRRFGVDSTLRHLLAGYIVVTLAIGVSAIIAPHLVLPGGGTRLRGDAIGPTGSVAVMGLILLLSYPMISRRTRVLARSTSYLLSVALLFTFLVMSQTRTAFIAMLLFGLLAFVRPPASTPLRSFLYFLLMLVPVALWFGWTSTIFEGAIREEETVDTLSDRTPLWQTAISETLEEAPLLGLGFYASRATTTAYNEGLGTSHSAYVEVFLGGGILSLSIFTILLVAEVFLVVRLFLLHGVNPKVFAVVGLFLTTLVMGITSEETVIASPTSFTFWILLSLVPAITRMISPKGKGGEIGTNQYGSSSSRILPAARRRG